MRQVGKTMKKLITAIMINAMMVSSVVYASAELLETKQDEIAIECLALNIYFETHASSLADAMAVSDVVINRVVSTNYPNTVCEVVTQGYEKGKHKCQFSWYCDGKADTPRNSEAWSRSVEFAKDMYLYGQYVGLTEGATHYHATYVKPYWAPTLDRVGRIGSHIFYREKGKK
jgi:spore germination cell wall hydrolase CwlJ-like protein